MEPRRRRVSRDTRLLFGIILIAVATLWVLARIRFPDRAPTPNPVPPVLAQLAPPSAFDDITSTVSQVGTSRRSSLLAVEGQRPPFAGETEPAETTIAALRFRGDVAVALIEAGTQLVAGVESGAEIARDPATSLAVLQISGGPNSTMATWSPRQLDSPRFLIAAEVRRADVSFRPVFVSSLYPIDSPLWDGPIWSVPGATGLKPGAFLFNLDGAFAGLAVGSRDGIAIVPAEMVVVLAERLSRETPVARGALGIRVQAMTSAIASATGWRTGVVATWIDPTGPAAGRILVTDVIERFGDQALTSLEYWDARMARLRAGDRVTLVVRRSDGIHETEVTAVPMSSAPENQALGLTLRTIRRTGAAVVRVDPQSVAFRAGIMAGDVITVIGDVRMPTAAEIPAAYTSAPNGAGLLVGITRGDAHRVVVLERPR